VRVATGTLEAQQQQIQRDTGTEAIDNFFSILKTGD